MFDKFQGIEIHILLKHNLFRNLSHILNKRTGKFRIRDQFVLNAEYLTYKTCSLLAFQSLFKLIN